MLLLYDLWGSVGGIRRGGEGEGACLTLTRRKRNSETLGGLRGTGQGGAGIKVLANRRGSGGREVF